MQPDTMRTVTDPTPEIAEPLSAAVIEDDIETAHAALQAARSAAEFYRQRSRDMEVEIASLRSEARRLVVMDEALSLLAEYSRDAGRLAELAQQAGVAQQRVADLEASSSWRITAPLRRASEVLKERGV